MLGTVGPPVPNVDVCLESVPEMGYDALGSTPRGEICVRGKTLFSGYYKREDLTKEVMVDGWFHTGLLSSLFIDYCLLCHKFFYLILLIKLHMLGDVGEWQPDGSLKIIDRKKNIFKLSQGEYVAVENLENIYGLCSAIDSVSIQNFRNCYLVMLVVPWCFVAWTWRQASITSMCSSVALTYCLNLVCVSV